LKVEIEGAPRNPRAGDDISDIGPVIAFAREYPLGVAQHLSAPGLSFHYNNPQENMTVSARSGSVKLSPILP
jgi:hypothetical protein